MILIVLTNTTESNMTPIPLFGKASLDISAKALTLNATASSIISTNRFEESLFQCFLVVLFNSFQYLNVFF